ncbi:MAG: sigma-70 family RNA polymerase sigma factor, partial [Planctomycetes bacterium]|nr:sigma-70 family RNA polymerase sigma factor [Planctomycetota bacterium]
MPPVDAIDDIALVSLVATRRDEEAFSQLFARYQRVAYSFAFHIVKDAKTAEDLVQESMVRVWSAAGSFRTDGADGRVPNVKAWIMTIVARESFQALRRRKRSRKEVPMDIEPATAPQDEASSSPELVGALRSKLMELPETDRQLIALHFGGGVSQREISEALSLSQQTISYRLNRILKDLRSSLSAARLAAAVPVGGESIIEALSSGHAPSAGLHARVLAGVHGAPGAVAASAAGVTVLAVSGAAIGLLGLGIWMARPSYP